MSDVLGLGGRVAIVTGAAQGIGLEYARGLARAGATVVLADVRDGQAAAEAVERETKLAGGRALYLPVDVTDDASTRTLAHETVRRFGRIDILVNNAAIYAGLKRKPWEEVSLSEWEQLLRVNVIGVFLASRAVAGQMKLQRDGRIINVASEVAFTTPTGLVHYSTSKAAVVGLTRALARELGPYGVRVNAISPGLVANEASLAQIPAGYGEIMAHQRPLQRELLPADLVGTVLYLCSDLSGLVTGQNVIVDGGVIFQ